jgi:hypothetical protein
MSGLIIIIIIIIIIITIIMIRPRVIMHRLTIALLQSAISLQPPRGTESCNFQFQVPKSVQFRFRKIGCDVPVFVARGRIRLGLV